MSTLRNLRRINWTIGDSARLRSDLADVARFSADLQFEAPDATSDSCAHHGRWTGQLPVWPFDRPEPEGLGMLVPVGLRVLVACRAAHPMVAPLVVPLDPRPDIYEHSVHDWHVAPYGDLCLMQSPSDWSPNDRISDLLLKACGWRIEYALMKAGVVDTMTLRGIVDDESRDNLVTRAAARAMSGGSHAVTSSPQEAEGDSNE